VNAAATNKNTKIWTVISEAVFILAVTLTDAAIVSRQALLTAIILNGSSFLVTFAADIEAWRRPASWGADKVTPRNSAAAVG